MEFKNQMALILGALVLGVGGLGASAQGIARQCGSAECACELALEQNTVEALEEFLKRHQHDAGTKDTACAALGVSPQDENAEKRKADYDPALAQPDGVSTD